MQTLLVIDGNAIMHRAFHAIPQTFSNDKGVPTNAIYGFFSMVFKILQDTKPSFLAICFDTPAATFRKSLYTSYQAKRPKIADSLAIQIQLLIKGLSSAKIQTFAVSGFEADDVIGTIASKAISEAKSKEFQIIILSGDRDMLQLVNRQVKVLMPLFGMNKMMLYDGSEVEKKFGLKPDQIVDYKALAGDSSDNYPGVLGIGPKTAAMLLQKYGTIDNLYRNISEVNKSIADKLSFHVDQAMLSKKLATIVKDCPISFSLKNCSLGKVNLSSLENFFSELCFNSLPKRLDQLRALQKTINRNQLNLF